MGPQMPDTKFVHRRNSGGFTWRSRRIFDISRRNSCRHRLLSGAWIACSSSPDSGCRSPTSSAKSRPRSSAGDASFQRASAAVAHRITPAQGLQTVGLGRYSGAMFATFVAELIASTDAELDDVLREAELARRTAGVRLSAVIANRGSFADHGHRSMKGYLKQQLNCSGVEANSIRRCASLVDQHPEIGDAMLEGRIGVGQPVGQSQ